MNTIKSIAKGIGWALLDLGLIVVYGAVGMTTVVGVCYGVFWLSTR